MAHLPQSHHNAGQEDGTLCQEYGNLVGIKGASGCRVECGAAGEQVKPKSCCEADTAQQATDVSVEGLGSPVQLVVVEELPRCLRVQGCCRSLSCT